MDDKLMAGWSKKYEDGLSRIKNKASEDTNDNNECSNTTLEKSIAEDPRNLAQDAFCEKIVLEMMEDR